jgi:hypothetical protein
MKARLTAIWGRICWNAWNHARKRELARRGWRPDAVIPQTDETSSPDQRRIVANEARQLLENRHLVEAFAAVHTHLEAQAHSCDPDNKDKAQRIVIAKQLLQAVRREILRKVDDGYMAEVEIIELEKRRGLLRFQR